MKQCILSAVFLLGLYLDVAAGVYRHDVPKKSYTDLAAKAQFDCVGQVLSFDKEKMKQSGAMTILQNGENIVLQGSCVLIGDRYVLSAAHVFMEVEYREDTMTINGHQAIIHNQVRSWAGKPAGYYFRFRGKYYQGSSITIFPGYTDPGSKERFDLAVVTLAEPVKDVIPATLGTATDELHARAVGVGYGASGIASKPEDVNAIGEKIAGENMIDELAGNVYKGNLSLMKCDFDRPVKEMDCNKCGDGKPLPLEYVSTGGDSGGGLFRQNNDKWELIGILSGGGTDIDQLLRTGYYGQTMLWTRVSLFYDWIMEQMNNRK